MRQNPKRILVVDDEAKIVEVVKSYLVKNGYDVLEAYSGSEALKKIMDQQPSLVILDIMLPDISGEEVCRVVRERSDIPIIMLTARVEEENILKGLKLGADDYVTKPFSPRQLIARVEAVLRRTSKQEPEELIFNDGDLRIDPVNYEVKKMGIPVSMTPNEYKILCALAGHPSKVFTRDELISIASGDDFNGFDRIIDTHIKNIRQKIETDPKYPVYILTVHGVGYRFGGSGHEA